MASTTPDVGTLIQQMSSLGISSQRLQAALRNPFVLKELLDEIQSKSPESSGQQDEHLEEDIEAEIKRVQATADKERELGPARSDPIPRDSFIRAMVSARKKFENKMHRLSEDTDQSYEIRKAFVGTEKYFSETPLHHLERSEHECIFVFCRVS